MIRPATPDDLADVLRLIVDLAVYEREPDAVVAGVEDLRAALFPVGHEPAVFCDVAVEDGRLVGIALWFRNFSTWLGKHGIYLEDLFVDPAYRGRGIGGELLAGLARRCLDNDWPRLEWSVLDWNTPSIEFYRALGAEAKPEWVGYRVAGDALAALAGGGPGRATLDR